MTNLGMGNTQQGCVCVSVCVDNEAAAAAKGTMDVETESVLLNDYICSSSVL